MKAWQKIWLRFPCAIRWAVVDAIVLAGGAAVYGAFFGGFEAAIHHEPGRILAAIGCFALGGLIAGAILGTFGALIESSDPVGRRHFTDRGERPSSLPGRSVQDEEEGTIPLETARRSRETWQTLRVASACSSHHFRM